VWIAGLGFHARNGDAAIPSAGETGKNRVLIAKRKICGIREGMRVVAVVGAEAATRDFKLHQLTRIVDRKQPQQNLIEQRKNSGIGANSERKRKNSGHFKSGFRTELPEPVSKVLPNSLQRVQGIHFVYRLADIGGVAERSQCRVACSIRAHSARTIVVDLMSEIGIDFARQIFIALPS